MPRMTHKDLIASLPAETRRALCAQSDGPGLLRLAVHLGLIGGVGWAIAAGVPGWPLLMVIQGILLVFLFTCLHEVIHLTAFRTDALNRWAAHICGFAVCMPALHFRYFHMAHHRFTHDPDHDPELEGGEPDTTWKLVKYLSGLPEWGWRVGTLWHNATQPNSDRYVPARGRARVQREARIHVLGYAVLLGASVALQTTVLLWVWIIPLILGNPFLRAYLMAEHRRCPYVSDMLDNTRTTFTNRIVRWLAWNMPYHVEHHAYPAVPFHRLPRFHEYTRAHLRHTQPGYAVFAASCLADPAQGIRPARPQQEV